MTKIFESPDRGRTVYEREAGSPDRQLTKESVKVRNDVMADMQESKMWGEIRRLAKTNPTMQDAVDRVIMLYKLIKEENRG